jgi:D-alanine-D-alanine ligase-like ATP-grasp enzyme
MPFVHAPLYTQYIKKKDEYRVHIFGGKVIDVQRKAVRPGHQNPDFRVRNTANGFIFVRNDVEAPADVLLQATNAVTVLGLTFGACDVIYNAKSNKAYILEVNTAPGLTGTTLENYINAIIG